MAVCIYCGEETGITWGINTRRTQVWNSLLILLLNRISPYLLSPFCRAGPLLSAYNYDSVYGKRALLVMYKGIIEQVSVVVIDIPYLCLSVPSFISIHLR